MTSLQEGFSKEVSLSNWSTIATELDQIGINIEESALTEIVDGKQE